MPKPRKTPRERMCSICGFRYVGRRLVCSQTCKEILTYLRRITEIKPAKPKGRPKKESHAVHTES